MRLILPSLLMLLLAACPAGREADTNEPAAQPSAAVDEGAASEQAESADAEPAPYSAAVLDYVEQCLSHPTEPGYPPLEPVWLTIAQLERLADTPAAAGLRAAVSRMVEQAGELPPPQLVAAWLGCEPQAAGAFIADSLAAGDVRYIDSLSFSPAAGRKLLGEMELAELEADPVRRIVRLMLRWPRDAGGDVVLLRQLAEQPNATARLQAIGLLAALGEADERQLDQLGAAVRAADETLPAAAEGIRLSGDAELAGALVNLAAGARLGDEDPEQPKQREVLYASYALTGLPGEQARLLRAKLLGSADPTVRWEARLGELLQGEPSWWDEAVRAGGADDPEIWMALDPPDVSHPLLLPTLRAAASLDDPHWRSLVAAQLNRYGALASDREVRELVDLLLGDADAAVRGAAWSAAGTLGLWDLAEEAEMAAVDEAEDPAVRIGAALCALRAAEGAGR